MWFVMAEGFVWFGIILWLIRQQEMPDYMGLSGLERMEDIGGLAAHFKKELALRRRPQPERGSTEPCVL